MKFKHILIAMALPALAFLSSCGGDPEAKPKPNVTFQTGAGFTSANASVRFDSILKIGIRATTGDKKLAKVEIFLSTNGGIAGSIWDSITSAASLNYDYMYQVKGGTGDVQKFEVVVTDDNGETASVSFSITVKPVLNPLKQTGSQYVYNIIGPEKGSYDLNAGIPRAKAESDKFKDLVDQTTASAGGFSKAWGSLNGTKFVRVADNHWAVASSTEYLYDLWTASAAGATTTITDLKANDYILVKTGQAVSFNIYLIKIDEVKETPGDNNDYVKFSYYKEDI